MGVQKILENIHVLEIILFRKILFRNSGKRFFWNILIDSGRGIFQKKIHKSFKKIKLLLIHKSFKKVKLYF